MRVDAVEAGDGFAGQASFTRTRTNKGVSLRLADGTGRYLLHDRGVLTAGSAANKRTAFVLG